MPWWLTLILIAVGGYYFLHFLVLMINWYGVTMRLNDGSLAQGMTTMIRGSWNRMKFRVRPLALWKHYVDYIKVIPKEGPTRFVMVIRSRFCAHENFERVKHAFHQHEIPFDDGVEYDLGSAGDTFVNYQPWILVECGQDADFAFHALFVALTEGFKLPENTKIRCGYNGGIELRKKVNIGWDRETPESTDEGKDGD